MIAIAKAFCWFVPIARGVPIEGIQGCRNIGCINELFVLLLEVGYLGVMPRWVFWCLGVVAKASVAGGEEAQDTAVGPH